ncbi:TonB-dependent receptor [Algibacter pacificus]|uniref:TonB-dependent receptor n=1 Tax=Algibacter pacificus TaxID=2599389 RepID=UPI0011C84928|nr:TonB-dependent receptor [Algibacter pacificus]
MKKNNAFLLIALLFSFIGMSQEGNIQGVITDNDGLKVPFCNIIIESLKKGAISDVDGNFVLVDVPVGNHTVTVRYIGYDDANAEVMVSSNATVTQNFTIVPKALELDGVTITSYASGQAKALNAQKNKQNITNVVSTDQIGKFPDANIGDAIKRIPGITMQVDQGEARNIIVRGLAPQLNSVTLNGSRIPSAEGDNRNVQMDLIPADMIQLIEVSKAVTPDMDADALGGSVNLVTRTSPNGFRVSATAGSGVNYISNKKILNGSFLLGNRSDNGKFGWMLSASVNDNDFGSHNFESEWEDEFEYNANDDEDNLVEENVNPYVKAFEIRDYVVQRVRRSFSANVDYEFNANNSIYFKSIYNWRDDRENRFRLESEILDGEDIATGDFTIDANGNLSMFPVEAKRQTKGGIDNSRNKNTRLEDQRMQNYNIGGKHLLNKLQMDWMASYSKASEERLNERYLEYESEYSINYNNDSRFPLFTPVNANDALYNNFEFGELTEENQYTEEKDFNILANFKLPLNLFNDDNGSLKFGVKTRLKNKNRDNNFIEYSPEDSAFDLLGGIPTQDYSNPDFLAGSQYAVGSFASKEFLGGLDLNDVAKFEAEDLPDEYLTANFDVDENVFSGYAMTNQQVSEKLNILLGVRLEHTSINSTGNEIIFDEDGDFAGSNSVTDKNSYTNILPGVHLKYNLTDQTILRFAWTNTLARPNYIDLVPFREVNNEDEEIKLGNSELNPTTSMNFDVMAEHYFKSVGLISGGVFYKDIQDFIYVFQYEDENDYDVYQPFNGDKASILGFEFAFQRQLDFLPSFARNLSVYLNYTHLSSSADGIRNEDGDVRTDLDLPNTAPNMFNTSLAYADRKFNARLSGNYSAAYVDEIGGRAFEDRYYDKQFFLDFNAGYKFSSNLSVYLSLNNITDQPLRYYQGEKSRTMQSEYYGQRLTFGLKYDLFKRK